MATIESEAKIDGAAALAKDARRKRAAHAKAAGRYAEHLATMTRDELREHAKALGVRQPREARAKSDVMVACLASLGAEDRVVTPALAGRIEENRKNPDRLVKRARRAS